MKLLSFTNSDSILNLVFDTYFTKISFLKMCIDESNEVECENIEIKFSKNKNNIQLLNNEQTKQIIIYINDIDGENINCAFNVNLTLYESQSNIQSNIQKQLLIKNQNIFAKIKNTNGTTKNIKAF